MKDLTKYNYEELVERITNVYKDNTGSGDGFGGSTGQMLIELLADATDHLHFMLERRSQEAFSSIARLESSIWMAASSVGYVPRRNVSARGVLEITLTDKDGNPVEAEFPVNIPYGTVVTFEDEQFIVAEDTSVLKGDTKATIEIVEGVTRTDTFNFSASPYFEDGSFTLEDYQDIEEFSLFVSGKAGLQYTYVDEVDNNGFRAGALSFAPTKYPGYDIRFSREGMRVVFGDDRFGKRPDGTVNVRWLESKGSGVSIVQKGLDFELPTETIQDSRSTIPKKNYFYTLKNTTAINGGTNSESIEEIRDNISAFIRSNDRAVTNGDYEFRVKKSGLGGIRDVNVYGERENDSIIFTMNNVYVVYVNESEEKLNAKQKRDLNDYLDRYKVNTTHVVYKEAIQTPVRLGIDFKRHPSLPISNQQLYNYLLDNIDGYFAVGDGVIGKGFQYSEFVSFLQNLEITFNKITYPLTDYVYVSASAFFPFEVPMPSYDGIIELSYDYEIDANDTFSVVVDGETYSVKVQLNDDVETLISKMRNKLFSNTPYMLALEEPNQIRIRHPKHTGTFTVSVATGDLVEFARFRQLLQLPVMSAGAVTGTTPQMKEGSMVVKDSDDVPIMTDKEQTGFFVSKDGYFYPDALIDYQKALMELPTVPDGTYYVEYQQGDFQNFSVALDGYITYSDFPSWQELNNPTADRTFFSYLNILDS